MDSVRIHPFYYTAIHINYELLPNLRIKCLCFNLNFIFQQSKVINTLSKDNSKKIMQLIQNQTIINLQDQLQNI